MYMEIFKYIHRYVGICEYGVTQPKRVRTYMHGFTVALILFAVILNFFIMDSNAEENGKIILTFDDSYLIYSVRDNALPLMKQYGYVGLEFCNSGYLEYSWSKVKFTTALWDLVNAGWEIGSHTYSHAKLNSLSYDQLIFEITTCERLYEDFDATINSGLGVISFAHPYVLGWENETVDAIVRQTYRYARPPLIKANYPPEDPGAWGMTFVMKEDDIEIITQKAIQFAKNTGTWAWLMFHGIGDQADYELSNAPFVSTEKFKVCLDIISKSNLEVITPKDYELSLIEIEPSLNTYCVTIFKNGTIVITKILTDIEEVRILVENCLLNDADLIIIQLINKN